jgi:hypothetical protein
MGPAARLAGTYGEDTTFNVGKRRKGPIETPLKPSGNRKEKGVPVAARLRSP